MSKYLWKREMYGKMFSTKVCWYFQFSIAMYFNSLNFVFFNITPSWPHCCYGDFQNCCEDINWREFYQIQSCVINLFSQIARWVLSKYLKQIRTHRVEISRIPRVSFEGLLQRLNVRGSASKRIRVLYFFRLLYTYPRLVKISEGHFRTLALVSISLSFSIFQTPHFP